MVNSSSLSLQVAMEQSTDLFREKISKKSVCFAKTRGEYID